MVINVSRKSPLGVITTEKHTIPTKIDAYIPEDEVFEYPLGVAVIDVREIDTRLEINMEQFKGKLMVFVKKNGDSINQFFITEVVNGQRILIPTEITLDELDALMNPQGHPEDHSGIIV